MNHFYFHHHRWFFVLLLVLSSCRTPDPEFPLSDDFPIEEESSPPIKLENHLVDGQYMVLFHEESIQHPEFSSRSASVPSLDDLKNATSRTEFDLKTIYEKNNQVMTEIAKDLLESNRVSSEALIKVYSGTMKGMVVKLTEGEKTLLESDERVKLIEPDQVVAFSFFPMIKTPFLPSSKGSGNQVLPYGVQRVGGSVNFLSSPFYLYRWAWIVDTGIDMNHNDLNISSYYSRNFTNESSYEDKFGHGTHVAGIIGAVANNRGVRGVAAGAKLVNVKVLDDLGTGTYSDIVAGLDYIGFSAWPDDVVNVSLGGMPSYSVDYAVTKIANSGVKVVIAAGNASQNVNSVSPARVNHNNVFTIGAIDNLDQFTSFSNYGSGVDFAAPGQDILSTFINNGYAYVSGTSMAAPHMTGVLIVAGNTFSTDGSCSPMPNGQTLQIVSH